MVRKLIPCLVLVLGSPGLAGAQSSGTGTVAARGVVEIKKAPETMRLQTEIRAQGANLKEALARLKGQQDQARSVLAKLGAAKDAVEFAGLMTAPAKDLQSLEPPLLLQLPGLEKGIAGRPTEPQVVASAEQGPEALIIPSQSLPTPPVVVAMFVKADFALKAASAEELLALRQQVQEQYRKGMESGKEANGGGCNCGAPLNFSFVRKISDEEHDHALAEAFRQAKDKAHRLAKAAGGGLGSVRELREETAEPTFPDIGRSMDIPSAPSQKAQPDEALSVAAGAVTYRVAVTIVFHLQDGR